MHQPYEQLSFTLLNYGSAVFMSPEGPLTYFLGNPIDVGAKIAKGCLFAHVPSESSNIEEILRSKAFKGTRPSIWAFQVIRNF